MEQLLDEQEYDELWKEIRNDWNLDDFQKMTNCIIF